MLNCDGDTTTCQVPVANPYHSISRRLWNHHVLFFLLGVANNNQSVHMMVRWQFLVLNLPPPFDFVRTYSTVVVVIEAIDEWMTIMSVKGSKRVAVHRGAGISTRECILRLGSISVYLLRWQRTKFWYAQIDKRSSEQASSFATTRGCRRKTNLTVKNPIQSHSEKEEAFEK